MDQVMKKVNIPEGAPFQPYGSEHQDNGKGGKGPLRQKWTLEMSPAMPSIQSTGGRSPGADKPIFTPYGHENQSNGRGGKGPLGKQWTTGMDQPLKRN